MKKMLLVTAAVLMTSTVLFAQTKWKVDKAHAKIGFTVRHMMLSDVEGSFRKFEASIVSSKPDFSDAVFEITIDAASINTENESRDKDLRSEKYFDVAKYPEITFKSTSVEKKGENGLKVTGNLSMHGVTKPVTVELKINGGTGAAHKATTSFKMSGSLDRTKFNVGSVPSAMIGTKIELRAEGEFVQE